MELEFKKVQRKPTSIFLAEVTLDYIEKVLSNKDSEISVSEADASILWNMIDVEVEGYEIVGFVAMNPENEKDKWFVAYDYALEHYEI